MTEEECKKQVESLENEALVVYSSWAGFSPIPGYGGLALKENGELYSFESRRIKRDDSEIREVKKIATVPKETIEAVKKFIEEEKIFKTVHEDKVIMDASFHVYFNYNGQHKEIKNDIEIYKKVVNILPEQEDKYYKKNPELEKAVGAYNAKVDKRTTEVTSDKA